MTMLIWRGLPFNVSEAKEHVRKQFVNLGANRAFSTDLFSAQRSRQ